MTLFWHTHNIGTHSVPEGVSTTDIVGRMLLCSRMHHIPSSHSARSSSPVPLSQSPETRRKLETAGSTKTYEERSSKVGMIRLLHHGEKNSCPGQGTMLNTQANPLFQFLTTSSAIRAFSRGMKPPKEGDRIVYIDGSWDMFHAGHVKFLEHAKGLGDYLIGTCDAIRGEEGIIPDFHLNGHVC